MQASCVQRRSSIDRLFQAVTTADISRLPVDSRMPDIVIYRSLAKFLLSYDKMLTYGYPLPDPDSEVKGKALIPRGIYPTTTNYFNSNQRTCSRCKNVFQVKEDGTPVIWKRCFYHKGLLKMHPRTGIQTYSCCFRPISSLGCKVSDSHVVDGSGHPDYDRNFLQTERRSSAPPAVYALDCEMVSLFHLISITNVTASHIISATQRSGLR